MVFKLISVMKRILCFCLAALALFVIASSLNGAPGPKKHMGIQVYSVKGFESDIPGSLKALADDGYAVLEIANYDAGTGLVAGYKPAEFATLVKKYGMEVISSHARAKFDVKDEAGTLAAWGKVFDDHKLMGCKYVVLPMNMWAGTLEGVKAECDLMNKIGDEANKRGIKFGYHNHNLEFATLAKTDQLYEDVLIANTNPEKVFFEMDVYWITVGGQDPVAYLKKYPTRFQALHIKDEYVVGATGKINYQAIFNQFYKNGHQDWFVELEAKMTKEQHDQSMAMMEAMKKIQAQGGTMKDMMDLMAKNQPKPDQKSDAQGNAPGKDAKSGQGTPPPGIGPKDPKVVAEQLKISLQGIKESADYLIKSDFVK
jgi:sugar phosphate isomerase/epimerase